jgi:hypothetical protein
MERGEGKQTSVKKRVVNPFVPERKGCDETDRVQLVCA